jgi:predicted nucleic acid-binding protein
VKIVSDTSPICYLLLIGQADLLGELFERVWIPLAVRDELEAVPAFRGWLADPPAWLESRAVPAVPDAGLGRLHPGEREAILLSEVLQADLVLLDEKKARQVARGRGLAVMGLLGVLDQAAQAGLVPLADAVERLGRTSFRVEPRLIKALLDRHVAGRTGPESEKG